MDAFHGQRKVLYVVLFTGGYCAYVNYVKQFERVASSAYVQSTNNKLPITYRSGCETFGQGAIQVVGLETGLRQKRLDSVQKRRQSVVALLYSDVKFGSEKAESVRSHCRLCTKPEIVSFARTCVSSLK